MKRTRVENLANLAIYFGVGSKAMRRNRRKSEFERLENRFFGCFSCFRDTFDRGSPGRLRVVGRISDAYYDLRRVDRLDTR